MDVSKAEIRTNLKQISTVSWKCELIHIKSPYFKPFGFEQLPLSRARVDVEYKGLSDAMVNAIRRTMIDEVIGHIMWFEIGDVVINDLHEDYAQPDFVRTRIASIPLRMGISKKVLDTVRFELDIENKTPDVLSIYARDLRIKSGIKIDGVLFNPNFKIAEIRPGKALVIKNIHIVSGFGRDNALFHQTALATMSNTDINSEENIQSTISDSIGHKLSFYVKATTAGSDVKRFYNDILQNLIERFRSIEFDQNIIQLDKHKQLVMELDHTETIAHLLHQAIFDITKNKIHYVNYCMDNTTKLIKFTITDKDPIQILTDAVEYLTNVIEKLYL